MFDGPDPALDRMYYVWRFLRQFVYTMIVVTFVVGIGAGVAWRTSYWESWMLALPIISLVLLVGATISYYWWCSETNSYVPGLAAHFGRLARGR
jgi:hypothetical protein